MNRWRRRFLRKAAAWLAAAGVARYFPAAAAESEKPNSDSAAVTGAPSHHRPGGGFVNPYSNNSASRGGGFRYFRMRWNTPHPSPADGEGLVPRRAVDWARVQNPPPHPQAMWVNHATFLIQHKGVTILTDPVLGDNIAPVPFFFNSRYTPPAFSLAELKKLPPVDIVLLSHNHYDHLNEETVRALGRRPLWLAPLGLGGWLKQNGAGRVAELDWWQAHKEGGIVFTAAPIQHWSRRIGMEANETLWCSWAAEFGDFRLWFGGDTGYNPAQFKEIGARLGGFDLALIPVGAYAPRWFMKEMHINGEEAAAIHREVRAKKSLGMHWGTFVLSAEPFLQPKEKLAAACAKQNIPPEEFFCPDIGEIVEFPPA